MNEQKKQDSPFIYRNYVRWPIIVAMILVVAAGIAYIFVIDPTQAGSPTVPCLFHRMTGLYCVGCGNTRALHALVHGEILEMFGYNILFPFVVVILAWCYIVGLTTLLWRRRILWLPEGISNRTLVIVFTVVILFAVLRNIPMWPFSILAP